MSYRSNQPLSYFKSLRTFLDSKQTRFKAKDLDKWNIKDIIYAYQMGFMSEKGGQAYYFDVGEDLEALTTFIKACQHFQHQLEDIPKLIEFVNIYK